MNFDNISKSIAEGTARESLKLNATTGDKGVAFPHYQRYVVLDVIFDPQAITDAVVEHYVHEIGISNIEYVKTAPRNSIIAKRVMNNTSPAGEKAMLLYPFFPPHFAMPITPGEHVWVMFEDPEGTKRDLGYWICRIVTAEFVEDVNHTHAHRLHDPSFFPGTKDSFNNKTPFYEFRNGSVAIDGDERYTVPETASLDGGDDEYVKLMLETNAGRVSKYEPVPKYRKRPNDIAIEGSNNSLIVLGRDRQGPSAIYDDEGNANIPRGDVSSDGGGMIDIVVGRGQTQTTLGNLVENSINNNEIDKLKLSPEEGDPDFINDRARILVSQKVPVDERFSLSAFNRQFSAGTIQGEASNRASINDDNVNAPEGDSAVAVKSDKIRLIARSDIELVVQGYVRDADGKMIASEDESSWAAIVIKSNGDIVIRPASQGYIKLGGDDADKALVCSDLPAVASNGIVSGAPLITTMGGQYAGAIASGADNGPALATGQGKFASKVLVK